MRRLRSINPYSGKINQEFDPMPFASCEKAVGMAKEALASWRKKPVSERVKPAAALASILRNRSGEYGRIITEEMGKPIRLAVAEVEKCALACDYYCENAEKFLRGETFDTEARKSYVRFEPLGVILGVMPWNFPFWQVVRWAVPALAAGNVCLLKHASNVPITAIELEKIFREAGFPDNTFQTLLIGPQPAERLIDEDLVDGVSITGSVQAGSAIGAVAGKNIKKMVLELGGSDPFVVLEDADVEKAARTAVKARMSNTGQNCIAAKRLIVAESVADRFLEKFMEALGEWKVGDPMNKDTDMGPVAREEFLEGLSRQFEDAVKKGATVHYGPKPPDTGFFCRPAVLTDVKPDMKVVREEVFGPIAPIIRAGSEAEMIRIANDTDLGLGGSVWSKNIEKAEKLSHEINAGFVAVNGMVSSDPRLPFGGIKKSGYGRELSHFGLKEFVNAKTVVVND